MNERITELALDAGGSHYPEVGGKTLERFAELLVRETIAVLMDCEYQEQWDEVINDHFGFK